MPSSHSAHPIHKRKARLSPKEKRRRKQRLLTHGTSSITPSIADAVVIKHEEVFFLANPDGGVPLKDSHGLGLYYHDCRFLNGYELKVANAELNVLVSDVSDGFRAIFELTNPEIKLDKGQHIRKDELGVKLERVIDGPKRTLYDIVTFQSYSFEPMTFPITLWFQAGFEDVFQIRGLLHEQPGELRRPDWQDGRLRFRYDGADGLSRSLTIHFSPTPQSTKGTSAHYQVTLRPRQSARISLAFELAEAAEERALHLRAHPQPDFESIGHVIRRSFEQWRDHHTSFASDNMLLDDTIARSLHDLYI